MSELSRADRAAAIIHLDRLRTELAEASTWLTLAGEDKSAILLEDAERDVGAALWDLDKPVRASRPAGWLDESQAQPRPYQD